MNNDTLVKLAQEFGTPLYVYEADKIKQQYERLVKAFEGTDARFFLCSQSPYQH